MQHPSRHGSLHAVPTDVPPLIDWLRIPCVGRSRRSLRRSSISSSTRGLPSTARPSTPCRHRSTCRSSSSPSVGAPSPPPTTSTAGSSAASAAASASHAVPPRRTAAVVPSLRRHHNVVQGGGRPCRWSGRRLAAPSPSLIWCVVRGGAWCVVRGAWCMVFLYPSPYPYP